jgi:hypothetical protein
MFATLFRNPLLSRGVSHHKLTSKFPAQAAGFLKICTDKHIEGLMAR